jgi:predicted nucleic-acid-binding Zn-ribbon protein
MAYGDYITCCKCGVKLLYDGDRSNRDWWEERFGKEPQIKCPDCESQELEEEPIAWIQHKDGDEELIWYIDADLESDLYQYTPLYDHPTCKQDLQVQQPKPLTDERIEELCWTEAALRLTTFARAIEAAHGIKEQP